MAFIHVPAKGSLGGATETGGGGHCSPLLKLQVHGPKITVASKGQE